MDVFLRLKHWHIFVLTFGILVTFAILQLVVDLLDLYSSFKIDIILFGRIVALVGVASNVAFACWSWVAGFSLTDKRPYDEFNPNLFKTAIVFQVFNAVITEILFPLMAFRVGGLNLILAFATLAAGLYTDYCIVKALNSVEADREKYFGDFVGDFFLLVFYPIGIWWLQPRINKIFDKEGTAVDPYAPLDQSINIES